jgi:O-antigen ligase
MILITLWGLCLVGSYYYALDHEIAGKYGWEYFKIIIMLLLSCFIVTERWHVRYLAMMIFGCLIYLVYEINALYLFKHRLDIFHIGFGGYDNNGAALLITMVIPFCYYFFQAERRWWRWGYLACIFPTLHAIMLTYSRGAMLSALVVGVAMLLWSARKHILQTLCIGIMVVMVVLSLAGPEVRNRFWAIGENTPGSSRDLRFRSWRAGWNIAKDYPLFGVGLRNSNLLVKSYGADMEGRTIHNIYLQISADAGFPAGFCFLLLVLITLWHLLWAAKRAKTNIDHPELRWHHFICLASFWSLSMFAFGSLFLSSETYELCYLLMLFGAVAPTLSKYTQEQDPEELSPSVTVHPVVKPQIPVRGLPV